MPRALLIGANYIGTSNELHGCINDSTALRYILITKYGYLDENVLVLTDTGSYPPTRSNILAGIVWLYGEQKASEFKGDAIFHEDKVDQSRNGLFDPSLTGILPAISSLSFVDNEENSEIVLELVKKILSLIADVTLSLIEDNSTRIVEKLVKTIFSLFGKLKNSILERSPKDIGVLDSIDLSPLEHLPILDKSVEIPSIENGSERLAITLPLIVSSLAILNSSLSSIASAFITKPPPIMSAPAPEESVEDELIFNLKPKANERYFFSFSGHGTQIRDSSGDEKDALDEVICPLDYQSAGFISDDLLNKILCNGLPTSSQLSIVLDCCNSGTAMDLPQEVKKSFFGRTTLKGDDEMEGGRVMLISGCTDKQTSADVSRNGQNFGACTYSIVQVLSKNGYHISYKDLINQVKQYIKDQRFSSQEPVMSFSREVDISDSVRF